MYFCYISFRNIDRHLPLNNQSKRLFYISQGYLNTKDELTKKSIVISIEKSSKKLAPELRKVLNGELQGLSGEKSALYKIWWGRLGSNQRPSGYEPPALTPELRPQELD